MTTTEVTCTNLIDAAKIAGVYGVVCERYGSNREDFINYRILEIDSDNIRMTSSMSYFGPGGFTSQPSDREDDTQMDRWSVPDQSEFPVPLSYSEFFEEINPYTYFSVSGSEYIYYGFIENPDKDELEAIFYNVHYMDRIAYGSSYLGQDSERAYKWEIVRNDDGSPKELDSVGRMMLNRVEEKSGLITQLREDVKSFEELNRAAIQDIKTINRKINEYAEETDMCSDYERRLDLWNDDLTVKLVGREREWIVPIRINALSDHQMSLCVTATSEDAARQAVSEMTIEDIIPKLIQRGWSFEKVAQPNFNGCDRPYI